MLSERARRLVDRLLGEAEEALAAGDWATARLRSEAVLRLDPTNEDATVYLDAAQTPEVADVSASPAPERRQLAVMFCDLWNSTQLSDGMDPEELRVILREYHQAVASVVESLDGYIARYMGDGVLVYFGYPAAHENDPDRAVKAGLGIIDAVGAMAPLPDGSQPQVRVGIHYGLAVVAEMGSGSRLEPSDVVGETANIASRLQSLAEPSTIAISSDVATLLRQPFALEPLGKQTLKGISREITVYRATAESVSANRPAHSTFVGRVSELNALETRWASARQGKGGVVVVCGEAGFGKTRLCQELFERQEQVHKSTAWLTASPFYQNTAFRPLSEYFSGRVLQLREGMTDGEKLARLEAATAEPGLDREQLIPALSALLNIAPRPGLEGERLTAVALKQSIIDAFVSWMRALASRQPLLLVVEDGHWIDPSTLEALQHLARVSAETSMLLVLTSRTSAAHFEMPVPVETIRLQRLDAGETTALVSALSQQAGVSSAAFARIAERSAGIPLFAQELVRLAATGATAAIASSTQGASTSHVPPALFGLLMARLDSLGPLRPLAQAAAVIGLEIGPDILADLLRRPRSDVREALKRLCDANILQRIDQRETYAFAHALIRDVAYESTLRTDRSTQHLAIADLIEGSYPATVDSEPETLAYHLEQAASPSRAVPYLREAAGRALNKSANKEAVHYSERALALLASMPESPQTELEVRIALGPPLIATAGYSSAAVERNYERAIAVSRLLSDHIRSFHALNGMRRFHQVRGGPLRARPIVAEMLALAENLDDPLLRGVAEMAAGENDVLTGDPARGLRHLRAAQELLRRALDTGNMAAKEPLIISIAYSGLALWFLGSPRAAIDATDAAHAQAESLQSPYGAVYALVLKAWVYALRSEPGEALPVATEARRLAKEHGFSYWEVSARCFEDWASTMLGDTAAMQRLETSLGDYLAAGARTAETWLLLLLAQARLAVKDAAGSREVIERALQTAGELGEHFVDAEALRWRFHAGQALGAEEADQAPDLAAAVELARRQGAIASALRSAVLLAEMSAATSYADRARCQLQEIIAAYPEAEWHEVKTARSTVIASVSSTPGEATIAG